MSISGAKLTAIRYLAAQTAPLLFSRATDHRLLVLTRVLERIARTQHHKAQLRYLRQLIQDQHPSLVLARRLMELHPNARRAVINNLGINATWLGDVERRAFAAEHGVRVQDEAVGEVDSEARCDLVGITAFTSSAPRAYELSDGFRERGIPVAIGGMHASACPEEALEHCDAVVVGEAEGTWPRLLGILRRLFGISARAPLMLSLNLAFRRRALAFAARPTR